jgi:hypothetical protein
VREREREREREKERGKGLEIVKMPEGMKKNRTLIFFCVSKL